MTQESKVTYAHDLPVLSIDAWRDGGAWYWNNMHKIGTVEAGAADLSDRRLLRLLRNEGILGMQSAGKVYVDRDGDYVTVCARTNGAPLYAIDLAPLDNFSPATFRTEARAVVELSDLNNLRPVAGMASSAMTVVSFPPDFQDPTASVVDASGACCEATIVLTRDTGARVLPMSTLPNLAGETTTRGYNTALAIAGALVRTGRRSWGQSGRACTIAHTPEGWEVRTLSRGQYDAGKAGRVIAIVACY